MDLVLSQEPLQGKAIFDLYDVDVQSSGFPTTHERILDYVEQRYLARVRAHNVRNFGTVLAKSLLKGVPAQWEPLHRKIIPSLVAVRDRAANAWPDVFLTIVRLIDNLEPANRPRAIAFVAAFPDFWTQLQEPTRTALQATLDNADPAARVDYRILAGVTIPQFRAPLLALITGLNRKQLADAIASQPLADLWPRAVQEYQGSGSWRGSEANFSNLITPFAGRLSGGQLDQLLDAIIDNGQNWDAAETDTAIGGLLKDLGRMIANKAFQMLLNGGGGSSSGGGILGSLFGLFTGGGSSINGGQVDFGGGGDLIPGLASGGSFRVGGSGGIDSQLVSRWMTPGELLEVTPPGQAGGMGGGEININLNPSEGWVAGVADQRIVTASGQIIKVSVAQSTKAVQRNWSGMSGEASQRQL